MLQIIKKGSTISLADVELAKFKITINPNRDVKFIF